MDQTMEGSEIGRFSKWLLAKEERFYVIFLISVMILFLALSMVTVAVISGAVVAGLWLLFYYAVLRKE